MRISPFELHIDDPEYYETLYSLNSPRDKYYWFISYANVSGSTFGTLDHSLHRLRRSAVAPYFSKQKIQRRESIIRSKVEKLCSRIKEFSGTGNPLHIQYAYSCFTTDVVTEYTCPRCWDFLDVPDLFPDWDKTIKDVMEVGMIARHLPGIIIPLFLLPEWLVNRIYPPVVKTRQYRRRCDEVTRSLFRELNARKDSSKGEPTEWPVLFNELPTCSLPPEQRTEERINHEIVSVLGAATETTSNTLAVITFHLLDKPESLTRLRSEVEGLGIEDRQSLKALEQLPYLVRSLSRRPAPGLTT